MKYCSLRDRDEARVSAQIISETRQIIGWLVGCFRFYGSLRQFFRLCRAVRNCISQNKSNILYILFETDISEQTVQTPI